MGPGGVIETFGDFRRSTKILIWVTLALGVALFAVCLTADLSGAGWLKSYAYIPNVLAGLTGFLIGVPFAAVILATFTTQREDQAALEKVNRLSDIAWQQFRDAVYEYCGESRSRDSR
jgi:hypothetical protein